MLAKFLFFSCCFTLAFSAKAPICTGITYYSTWLTCDSGKPFYNYTLDLDVTVDTTNASFPNKVKFSNFSPWSLDPSFYHPVPPVTFWYWGDSIPQEAMKWDLSTPSFEFNFPNGVGDFNFYLSIEDTNYDFEYPTVFIDNGEVVGRSELGLYYPGHSCTIKDPEDFCDDGGPKNSQYICCKNFVDVEIPDSVNEVCQSFESQTIVNSASGTSIASLNATFSINTEKIDINVVDFKNSESNKYKFMNIEGDTECDGTTQSPKSNCTFQIPYDDFHFDLSFISGKYSTIAMKLIRRSGILLMDGNVPFTQANSCWNQTSPIAFGAGAIATTNFCCNKFSSTGTSTVAPTVMASGSPAGKCLQYSSSTVVSGNSALLTVNYAVGTAGNMVVNITDYEAPTTSNVQFEAYSTEFFSQICKASTTDPQNSCIFNITDNKQTKLGMRTSVWPDGFNMLNVVPFNGQFIRPSLTELTPCYYETNPYNSGNSKVNATTQFCCSKYA